VSRKPARATPPRLALRLLESLLPEQAREAFLGDLLEEFHAVRVPTLGPAGARRWLWREAVIAMATLPARRQATVPSRPGEPRVRSLAADLRHAARLLRRSPAFTALCVLTLALGIGASTAIFSVVNPVLLRPLPYPAPERLVMVWERDADGGRSNTGFATFADLARETRTLERTAAVGGWEPTLSGTGDAERLVGQRVSSTYFGVLGVGPSLGRDFVAAEDAPAAEQVVILADGLWRRRFGADPALVGRAVPLDGIPHTVVGIMPASFDNVLNPDAQVWRPLRYGGSEPWACRTCRHLRMIARVRPGVTRAAASAELDQLSAMLVQSYRRDYPAVGTHVVPLREEVTRDARPVLLVVVGATCLVLLIACANVANLQLARAMRREGEFAIRVALGAGRSRLAQQMLVEGVLLAALGGAAGALVARLALPALIAWLPPTLPRLTAVRLDGAALALAAGVTLLVGILVGLAPALHGGRASVFDTLRGGARVAGGRHAVRAGLVVAEVAVALMLMAGAGLLSRSLVRLLSVDVGFEPAGLLTLELQASGPRYESDAAVWALHERVREAARAVPGVVAVGTASQLPLAGSIDRYGVRAQDRPLPNPELAPSADRYVVSPDFMSATGIRIRRGRGIDAADARDSARAVVVVSRALAAKLWSGDDPLGKRVQLGGLDAPWREVVGVADDVRHDGLDAVVTHQVYVPERQWEWANSQLALVVRTQGDPGAVADGVRRAVRGVDAGMPVTRVATMEQLVARSTAQRRLALTLFAAFAGVAILLAAAGIYGVLAGSVAERTREIGVRTALGATPGRIARLVVGQGVRLAAVGLAIGAAGTLALGRFLSSLLYGVGPGDPWTLAAVVAGLAAVAVVACLVPARRAAAVDPAVALRAE
jgi:putative ABC transport system permease protein